MAARGCTDLPYTIHTMHKQKCCPSPVPGIEGTGSGNPHTKPPLVTGQGFEDQQLTEGSCFKAYLIPKRSRQAPWMLLTNFWMTVKMVVYRYHMPPGHTEKNNYNICNFCPANTLQQSYHVTDRSAFTRTSINKSCPFSCTLVPVQCLPSQLKGPVTWLCH